MNRTKDFYEVALYDTLFRRLMVCEYNVKLCTGKRIFKRDIAEMKRRERQTEDARKRALDAGYTEQEIDAFAGFTEQTRQRAINEVYGGAII